MFGLCGCGPKEGLLHHTLPDIHEETQSIVFSILDDVRRMTALGAGHTNALDRSDALRVEDLAGDMWGQPDYRIVLLDAGGATNTTLELRPDRPLWAPSLYSAAVAALFKQARLSAPPAAAHTNRLDQLLSRLTDYRGRRMEEINQKLSRALEVDFLDPALHEQAALLLGVLLLRDASGIFCDLRGLMSRMTAHLAFARALAGEGERTPEGRVAEVILYFGMNHQVGALERLSKLPAGPVLDRWKRALRARVTLDYRGLDDWPRDTLLERAAWFAAYAYSVDPDLAWRRLPEATLGDPDLCRLACQAGYSVGLGHQLSALALPLETREIGELAALVPEADTDHLFETLNALPEPCVTRDPNGRPRVRVIGWGQWAAFFQRHLCHAIWQNHRFMRRLWGVPEAADKFAQACEKSFGGLWFYPFVRRLIAEDNRDQQALNEASDACARLVMEAPTRINPQLWGRLYGRPRGMGLPRLPLLPDISRWFRHNPPAFTAHQVRARANADSLGRMPDRAERLEALHKLAPYDPSITELMLHFRYQHKGRGQSPTVLTNAYGPVLEFSPQIMGRVAALCTNAPAVQETLLRRAARIEGGWYFPLGSFLVGRGEREQAAAAYEDGVRTCPDEVRVANNAAWLVGYYWNVGKTNQAEQLAARAADTYSAAGLRTMGNLRFWQERYAESLEYYRKVEKRYHSSHAVLDWWYGYVTTTGKHTYDGEVEQRLDTLFPGGIRAVALGDFKAPPKTGVEIVDNSPLLTAAGLKPGQIIVALDGKRTENLMQYTYVRHLLEDDAMRLIVWQGAAGYVEVTASPPNHLFGVTLRNYTAR